MFCESVLCVRPSNAVDWPHNCICHIWNRTIWSALACAWWGCFARQILFGTIHRSSSFPSYALSCEFLASTLIETFDRTPDTRTSAHFHESFYACTMRNRWRTFSHIDCIRKCVLSYECRASDSWWRVCMKNDYHKCRIRIFWSFCGMN